MKFDLCICGLCFRFNEFKEKSLFATWSWKVDAWRKFDTKKEEREELVINIYYKPSFVTEKRTKKLVYREKTGFFERRVYMFEGGDMLWELVRQRNEQSVLQFQVNSMWNEIILIKDDTSTQGSVAFEYIAQIIPGVLLYNNIFSIHASLIEFQGESIAICAASGVGKTTHARLWRDLKNAIILNGDRAVCKKDSHCWKAYGIPWSGTSGEQINRSAHLKAIVVLEQSEENKVLQLRGLEIFKKLYPHMLYPSWDEKLILKGMNLLDDLMKDMPVYLLKCRPDEEAVEVLLQEIW